MLSIMFVCLLASAPLWAHGDLHERINQVTEEIKEDPTNPALYFKRGQLYFHHEEYDNSLADYDKAIELGLNDEEIDYWKARLFLAIDETERGIEVITRYLSGHADDVNATRIYAKLALAAGDTETAITQFERVITLANTTLPENFMELVEVLRQTGNDERAIYWLQQGGEMLGQLYVFDVAMIAIYEQQQNYDAVIEIYNRLLANRNRKEGYYYEIAMCYNKMSDAAMTKQYLDMSHEALNRLPGHIQQTAAMLQLKKDIEDAYEEL